MVPDSNVYQTAGMIVPGLAGVLGLTALAGGSYSFVSPYNAIKGFGLYPPPLASNVQHAEAFQESLIQAYGIRNIGSGLSVLGLITFWLRQEDTVRKDTVKRCLGLTLMLGTAVGMGDAWLINNFNARKGVVINTQEGEKNNASGHAVTAVFIALIGGTLFFS